MAQGSGGVVAGYCRALACLNLKKVSKDLLQTLTGQQLTLTEIGHRCLETLPVLDRLADRLAERRFHPLPTMRALLDLGAVFDHPDLDPRLLEYLAAFMVMRLLIAQRVSAVITLMHPMRYHPIRMLYLLQGMSFAPRRSARSAFALVSLTPRFGFLIAIARGRLTAVAAVLRQSVRPVIQHAPPAA
jgi:hypothetical protein